MAAWASRLRRLPLAPCKCFTDAYHGRQRVADCPRHGWQHTPRPDGPGWYWDSWRKRWANDLPESMRAPRPALGSLERIAADYLADRLDLVEFLLRVDAWSPEPLPQARRPVVAHGGRKPTMGLVTDGTGWHGEVECETVHTMGGQTYTMTSVVSS